MRTYWLSFVNETGFAGVAIVQIDEDDAAACRPHLLPQSKPGAEWILAATRKARDMGCNPGGQVLAARLGIIPEGLPLNRLLTATQVRQFSGD